MLRIRKDGASYVKGEASHAVCTGYGCSMRDEDLDITEDARYKKKDTVWCLDTGNFDIRRSWIGALMIPPKTRFHVTALLTN
jgi:hypothetical protein